MGATRWRSRSKGREGKWVQVPSTTRYRKSKLPIPKSRFRPSCTPTFTKRRGSSPPPDPLPWDSQMEIPQVHSRVHHRVNHPVLPQVNPQVLHLVPYQVMQNQWCPFAMTDVLYQGIPVSK